MRQNRIWALCVLCFLLLGGRVHALEELPEGARGDYIIIPADESVVDENELSPARQTLLGSADLVLVGEAGDSYTDDKRYYTNLTVSSLYYGDRSLAGQVIQIVDAETYLQKGCTYVALLHERTGNTYTLINPIQGYYLVADQNSLIGRQDNPLSLTVPVLEAYRDTASQYRLAVYDEDNRFLWSSREPSFAKELLEALHDGYKKQAPEEAKPEDTYRLQFRIEGVRQYYRVWLDPQKKQKAVVRGPDKELWQLRTDSTAALERLMARGAG